MMNQLIKGALMLILGTLYVTHAVVEFCEMEIAKDVEILQRAHHVRNKRLSSFQQNNDHANAIRAIYGEREDTRYIKMFLVVDHAVYLKLGGDSRKVKRYCKNMVNIVNVITSQLNIVVVLVGVEIWSDRDKISNSSVSSSGLQEFNSYTKRLQSEHPFDHAQLLTGKEINNSLLGKAYVSTSCTSEAVSVIRVENNDSEVVQTMAHELGHNLNLPHDDTPTCYCPIKQCIMSASMSSLSHTYINFWSSCSKDAWRQLQGKEMYNCLLNKPISVFEGPDCGNGLLEQGEECDCGPPDFCDTTCCNARTCRLTANATCATGPCCDTNTCQFRRGGSKCRVVSDECDLPEFCSGDSELCPQDWHKADGHKCISDEVHVNCSAQCHVHGVCNNAGHCHCDLGYAPPYCSGPGFGGSVDSGPASDPTSYSSVVGVIIFLCGLILMSLLCLILHFYFKQQNSTNNEANKLFEVFTMPFNDKFIQPNIHAASEKPLHTKEIYLA